MEVVKSDITAYGTPEPLLHYLIEVGKRSTKNSGRTRERLKETKNVSPRQAKLKVPTSCPFQKRRRLCSLIAREVSRHVQLNLTELRKEVNELRMKINNVQQDRYREAYVILIGKNHQNRLTKMNVKDMYNIRWDRSILRKCRTRSSQMDATTLEQCRITRYSGVNFHYSDKRIISAVKVTVPGIYLLYCQLTFTINNTSYSNNIAHLISKVSILMTKGTSEHVELISQIPVVTRQGNDPLITVSVFTQAYLYSRSTIRVTISLKNGSKLPLDGNMVLELYQRNHGTFNVFGMHLLKKTDDRGPP
ncbi:uncharacterized protein LOC116302534 isoform X2 [Actinia tenebrosa]|uniref:Uncharacterized protein LOC116302534 isoform X2 n=1 Tax=Actinia tenebrosa TaxID=6105 RepID=A0A6P8ILQ5_ACTTE|nr:uncharacterized protein LOC116302534 isoform X2 [Actinia tenebrosa]